MDGGDWRVSGAYQCQVWLESQQQTDLQVTYMVSEIYKKYLHTCPFNFYLPSPTVTELYESDTLVNKHSSSPETKTLAGCDSSNLHVYSKILSDKVGKRVM